MAHGIGFVKGVDLGNELAKVIGIEGTPVGKLTLECNPRGAAIVTAEIGVDAEQASEIVRIMKGCLFMPIGDNRPDGHFETIPEGVTPIVLPPREDGHFE